MWYNPPMEYGILSIAIPLLTIFLAIITKDVVVSLIGGIFVGFLVLHGYNPAQAFVALFDGIVSLFKEEWITKTLLFIVLVGAVIRLLTQGGAVESFVLYLSQKANKIDSPKGAMLLAYGIGIVIFIESSITSLVAGTVSKSLCDKNGVSREKLAYICDSTSAPVCALIPLNAWGALLLGLIVTAIDTRVISGDPVSLLVASIPYNFYAIVTLLIVLGVIFFNLTLGSMHRSLPVPFIQTPHDDTSHSTPFPMLLPIVLMVAMVPLGLYFTGHGNIFKGSGSSAVYYAVIITLLFIYLYFIPTKRLTHSSYFKGLYEGISEMIPVGIIMIFALLIGTVITQLGTAEYLAHLLQGNFSPALIPFFIFFVASITSFATGTSWGTFSIMMPIGLALGATMDLHIPLVIAAVISGGIFGDHASPISDSTIIASMAAECDHISHVNTQLPYALLAAGVSSVAFLIAGWVTLS